MGSVPFRLLPTSFPNSSTSAADKRNSSEKYDSPSSLRVWREIGKSCAQLYPPTSRPADRNRPLNSLNDPKAPNIPKAVTRPFKIFDFPSLFGPSKIVD